jgi:hypothetical protein
MFRKIIIIVRRRYFIHVGIRRTRNNFQYIGKKSLLNRRCQIVKNVLNYFVYFCGAS